MSPVTHLLFGWTVANLYSLERRDRMLVTVAGVIPDLDGLGVVPEVLTRNTAHPLLWWTEGHHVICHNLLFGLVCFFGAMAVARNRRATPLLVLLSFHLHLICDVVGGRGPDGYIWTIPYLWPFTNAWIWSWQGQWKLNAWPNLVITAGLIAWTLRLAWKKGFSPLELISLKADAAVVATLRKRFPV